MQVYNESGSGFLEAIYHDAMEIELRAINVQFLSQKKLKVYYKGTCLPHEYIADMICCKRILLELEAVREIHDVHLSQVLKNLKATGLALGYVINFGNPARPEWQRVLMSDNLSEYELTQMEKD